MNYGIQIYQKNTEEHEMKKILFVIYALNNGGAERSLVNLLTEIDFTNRAGRTGGLGIFSIEKRDSAEKASYNIV